MTKFFAPMLAGDITDENRIKFPILASQKLDGVRATVQSGQLLSRSLKPFRNQAVQELFAGLPEGLDGELIVGDPTDIDAYRKTVSLVMSEEKPLDFFKGSVIHFHVFDKYGHSGFQDRLEDAYTAIKGHENAVLVTHVTINNTSELEQLEKAWLEEGHEGIMLRAPNGPYKEGRSTENEGFLLKLKRFADTEAVVIGFAEQNHNENEAMKDNLGYTERSTCKAGMVPAGVLGKLEVRGLKKPYLDVEFGVGGGFSAEMRKEFWDSKESLIGKIAKVKYFSTGSKDRPRFPVFVGWRDKDDM